MITRLLILAALFASLTGPAAAGPAAGEAARETESGSAPDETCPRKLDAPTVVVPVVSQHRLSGYAFVNPRICLSRGDALSHMERMHVLNDRLLRAGHRAPIVMDGDGAMSREATHAAMLEAVGEVIDPSHVARLDLLGEDILRVN